MSHEGSTVRRVRSEHLCWLRHRGVKHAYPLDPEVLTGLVAQASPLGGAVQTLAAAVIACRRRFGRPVESWPLIVVFVHGRLLAKAPTA